MILNDVYDALISAIGTKWDTYKVSGQSSLAKVGAGGKGVVKDFPVVLNGVPAVGVFPADEDFDQVDNDRGLTQTVNFRVVCYCYNAQTPVAMGLIVQMRDTIIKIVMSDISLGGKVHVLRLRRNSYGIIENAKMAGETKIVGCEFILSAEIFAEQIR